MYIIFIPKILGHYTVFQFCLNTQELCFCRWRTGPLAIPTSDFSFMFLALGIFTAESDILLFNIIVYCNVVITLVVRALIRLQCSQDFGSL